MFWFRTDVGLGWVGLASRSRRQGERGGCLIIQSLFRSDVTAAALLLMRF